ncbi:MAG: acetyl-CoA decarbonylase/synthase complex subunit gamma [Candidatus Eremiobacteraeota bacterium]|nr:acetyl-CoA decarbonylase/synthase complex subunit gamma [Candidatus Eremiobacteraeota bacterium]
MALTGMQVFKLLPRTNCGDCGFPKCLAFGMAVASGKADPSLCPHLSPDAENTLEEASSPPIRPVVIGTGEHSVTVGNETVLFRHEETFYNPTAFAVMLEDTMEISDLRHALDHIGMLQFERAGSLMKVNLVALRHGSAGIEAFTETALAIREALPLPLILMCSDMGAMESALDRIGGSRPLIDCLVPELIPAAAALAEKHHCPLVARAAALDEMAAVTESLKGRGIRDLVLSLPSLSLSEELAGQVHVRRLALKKSLRSLGYPTIASFRDGDGDYGYLQSAASLTRYASVIILPSWDPAPLLPLLTLRQNIYTDPQKPIQVAPGIYQIGSVSDRSPVLVTTNFSLTYFVVSGEIEASKIPSYLLVVDTDGTSVLTAWAADKFNGPIIGGAIEKYGIGEKVKHRTIVLPGHVAILSGAVNEASGWNALGGPREASGIPSYLKQRGPSWQ